MKVFMKYHWPGNVRELENMVRRMVVLGNETGPCSRRSTSCGATPRTDWKPSGHGRPTSTAWGPTSMPSGEGIDLKAISRRAAQVAEKRVIERVLQQTRWNRKEAAERLQISYKALLYKMKENGLSQGR